MYTKQNIIDLKNAICIDNMTDIQIKNTIKSQFKGIKTVCAKKRASKNHKRYYYIGGGFDTETTKFNDTVAFVYIWQFTISDITYYSRYVNKLSDFTLILSSVLGKKAKLLVYGANISYDFQFIKHYLEKQITFAFASEQRKILTYELNNNIVIMDCLGVWGSSLAKCTEYTTRKKLLGDLDYNKFRTPETKLSSKEMLYCIHDTLICSELVLCALDTYIKQGKKIPLTMTSIVRNELKDSYSKVEKKLEIESVQSYYENQRMYNVFRQFLYSGGWTHSNSDYVGIVLNNVKCYDIESSYPSQALKNFPSGLLIENGDNLSNLKKHKHWIMKIKMYNVSAKTSHTLISKHKICTGVDDTKHSVIMCDNGIYDNGRLFACSECEIYVNEIDFANIKKVYNFSFEVIQSWFFTKSSKISKKVFNMIVKYYKAKTILKKAGLNNTIEYKEAKSKLNSLYGMLCTQIYSRELVYNTETGCFETVTKSWEKCNKTIMNCFSGYWISAYARQQLVDIIMNFPEQIIQYDTDSIYCIDNDNKIENYVNKFNKEKRAFNLTRTNDTDCINLGIWDYDGTYNKFCGYGAKRYCGIKNNKLKITWAGGISEDIKAQYRIDKKLNRIDNNCSIFDYMKNFSCFDISSKKCARYIDEVQTVNIDGVTTEIKSCVVISDTTFKSVLSNELAEFKHKTSDLRQIYINDLYFSERGIRV